MFKQKTILIALGGALASSAWLAGTAHAADASGFDASPSAATAATATASTTTAATTTSPSEATANGPAPAAGSTVTATPTGSTAATAASGTADTTLPTVTVTARRRQEALQDVPEAVTAISGNTISKNELRVVNDITKYVPNFTAQSTEGRERPRWFLRGVGSNDPSDLSLSPIGVYFDDVYINNVFAQGFPLFDLDHIEVLRGPQGTLWGKNTIGGAVSLVSKKPTFDVDGYAKVGFAEYNTRLAEAAIGGPIGSNDVLAARVSVHSENGDSYFTNSATGERFGSFHDNAGRLQILATPTSNSDFLLNIHGRSYQGSGDPWDAQGTGANGANQYGFVSSKDPYTVSLNAPSSDRISSYGGSLTAHYHFDSDITLTSITALEGLNRWYEDDEDFTPADAARSHDELASHQFSQEFRIESPQTDRLSWIAGAHLFSEELTEDGAGGGFGAENIPAFYHRTYLTQHTESAAIFGSVKYRITDRFDITGGLRYTIERKTINLTALQGTGAVTYSDTANWWDPSSVSSPLAISAQQNQTNTWRAPTWDITPEYAVTDNLRTYFRYARGFRSGGYNGSAYTQSTLSTVQPEYLTAYELGVKSEWFDNRLTVNASVFHYDYRDIQVFALAPNPLGGAPVSTLSNAGQGYSDGFELELKAEPIKGLYLFTNLGLLDTRYTEFAYVPTAVGNSFARSPHTTIDAGGEYRLPLAFGSVALGGDVNYRSKEFFSATRQLIPQLDQGGYTVVNAHLSFSSPKQKYTLTFYVNNLTDKTYKKLELLPSYGAYPVLWGDPRVAGVTLTAKL